MGVCNKVLPVSLPHSATASLTPTAPVATYTPNTSTSQFTKEHPAEEESMGSLGVCAAAIVGISVGNVMLLGVIVGVCMMLTIMRNWRKRREQVSPVSPKGKSVSAVAVTPPP